MEAKLANGGQMCVITGAVGTIAFPILSQHGNIKGFAVRQLPDAELVIEVVYYKDSRTSDPPKVIEGFRVEVIDEPA